MAKTLLSKTITVTTGGQRFPATMAPTGPNMSSSEDEGRHHEGLLRMGHEPGYSAPNSGNVCRSMANSTGS